MSIRGAGERSKSYFDSIDYEILTRLIASEEGLGVLELADKLKLKHQSLKPHLDKLISLNVVHYGNIYLSGGEKKTVLQCVSNMSDALTREDFSSDKDWEEFNEDIKKEKYLMRWLTAANLYFFNIEARKNINLDLRRFRRKDKNKATTKEWFIKKPE